MHREPLVRLDVEPLEEDERVEVLRVRPRRKRSIRVYARAVADRLAGDGSRSVRTRLTGSHVRPEPTTADKHHDYGTEKLSIKIGIS
ncbi:hypothetical protein BN903_283 [Halorubrum sp. AJ67]|nr:hypothetical protein BN903_283 [Halorubrum sp. AJ67]